MSKDVSVIKVLRNGEWDSFQKAGKFDGSVDDQRDGFIHLSTAKQLAETVRRHYGNENEIWLISFSAAMLGEDLKWEESRGGDLFPHFYGTLKMETISEHRSVKGKNGDFDLSLDV